MYKTTKNIATKECFLCKMDLNCIFPFRFTKNLLPEKIQLNEFKGHASATPVRTPFYYSKKSTGMQACLSDGGQGGLQAGTVVVGVDSVAN